MSTWELIDVHEKIHPRHKLLQIKNNLYKQNGRPCGTVSACCVTTFQLFPVNNNVDDALIDLVDHFDALIDFVDHSDAFLIVSVFPPLNTAASARAVPGSFIHIEKYPTCSSN